MRSAPGFAAVAALLVLVIVNWLAGWIFGPSEEATSTLALLIGFAPLAVSLATLVLPFGGWWFQQQSGGRRPSERERAVFEAAFAQLQGVRPAAAPAAALVRGRRLRTQRLRLRRHADGHPRDVREPAPSRRSSPTSSGT